MVVTKASLPIAVVKSHSCDVMVTMTSCSTELQNLQWLYQQFSDMKLGADHAEMCLSLKQEQDQLIAEEKQKDHKPQRLEIVKPVNQKVIVVKENELSNRCDKEHASAPSTMDDPPQPIYPAQKYKYEPTSWQPTGNFSQQPKSSPFQWYQGFERKAYSRRQHNSSVNFFNLFFDQNITGSDWIADLGSHVATGPELIIIKDLWPNPLQYYVKRKAVPREVLGGQETIPGAVNPVVGEAVRRSKGQPALSITLVPVQRASFQKSPIWTPSESRDMLGQKPPILQRETTQTPEKLEPAKRH
ncbi:hypothetical protein MG293_020815 [Ovis ammon polii]|uniref:Uncharacterized protein n=1 Tax=Ovis ammon polii TaxID=230172 RepID=A0AAD4TMB9_OVIAM|nr:hypothetical protein MG293_020815 [Ovis ammon polii]